MQRAPFLLILILAAAGAALLFGSGGAEVEITIEEQGVPMEQEATGGATEPEPGEAAPDSLPAPASVDDAPKPAPVGPLLHPYEELIRKAPEVKPLPTGPELVQMPDGSKWPPLNGVTAPVRLNWPLQFPYYPPVGVVRNQLTGVDWYIHADGSHSTTIMASNNGGPAEPQGLVQNRVPEMEAKDLRVRPGSAGVPSNRTAPPPGGNQAGGNQSGGGR